MFMFLLLACLLLAAFSGLWAGRQLTVARHQGTARQFADAALLQCGVTLLTLLYGLFLQPASVLWPTLMLLGSATGLLLGSYMIQRHPPRELSSSQLRTDAILER